MEIVSLLFALIVVVATCGCENQANVFIDATHDYFGTTLTIKDLRTNKSEPATTINWNAQGGLVDQIKEQKQIPSGFMKTWRYMDLGIRPFPALSTYPESEEYAPTLVLSDGRNIFLEGNYSSLQHDSKQSVKGAIGSWEYYPIKEIRKIKIPGITVSLPFKRKIKIFRGEDGNYYTNTNSVKLDGGRIELSSIDCDKVKLTLHVICEKTESNFYPIAIDSYGLIQGPGKVLRQRGTGVKSGAKVEEQDLHFEKPKTDEDLRFEILTVRFAVPGEWVIKLMQ